MAEQNRETSTPQPLGNPENKFSLDPREFLAKYLKYLPWIIVSATIFIVLAYIKIRYSTPIYSMQSSLLIKNENDQGSNSSGKDISFNELFMNQGSVNLSNEMQILKSRPVLQRVARDLGLQKLYYNKGSIRSTLQYENKPFELIVEKLADSTRGFGFQVNILNDTQFLLNDSKTPI